MHPPAEEIARTRSGPAQVLMSKLPVCEWLDNPRNLGYVRRVAQRVAHTYHLSESDVPDLYQDVCLALWKAGPNRMVNATWIFHTANHRAIDLYKRKLRGGRSQAAAQNSGPRYDPEQARLVHATAARLPATLHRFYQMRFEEGYTQRELMQRANLTRGSIRGLEKECLRTLRGERREG